MASMGAEGRMLHAGHVFTFYYPTSALQGLPLLFTGVGLTGRSGWRALVETVFLVRVGHRVKRPHAPDAAGRRRALKRGTVSGGPCRRRPSLLGPVLVSRPSILFPTLVPIDLQQALPLPCGPPKDSRVLYPSHSSAPVKAKMIRSARWLLQADAP